MGQDSFPLLEKRRDRTLADRQKNLLELKDLRDQLQAASAEMADKVVKLQESIAETSQNQRSEREASVGQQTTARLAEELETSLHAAKRLYQRAAEWVWGGVVDITQGITTGRCRR